MAKIPGGDELLAPNQRHLIHFLLRNTNTCGVINSTYPVVISNHYQITFVKNQLVEEGHSIEVIEKWVTDLSYYITLEDFQNSGRTYSLYKLFYILKEVDQKKQEKAEANVAEVKEPEEELISYEVLKIAKF